ncbi:MAG: hypothetical protein JNM07_08615 [Phycisphaerae bacterium]|nr:hypothetical protein [Phycisphaerae bacterium]
MSTSRAGSARLRDLRPMLAVRDLPGEVRFYVERLGFNCRAMHGDPPVWAEVERDGVSIMLNAPPRELVERDVPRRSRDYQVYYVGVDDVTALHAEFRSRGATVSELRVACYGMKEIEVRDSEDHWLWFGAPTDEAPTRME